jgi:hypothetical protein
MQTKFIEGTNEQYSIREDGVVISHKTNKELKANKNGKVCFSLGARGKQKTVTISRLMKKHFNGVKCHHCENMVIEPYFKRCKQCIFKHFIII